MPVSGIQKEIGYRWGGATARSKGIVRLESRSIPNIGLRAAALQLLIRTGYATPDTFVCPWDTCERYFADGPDGPDGVDVPRELGESIARLVDATQRVAVRASPVASGDREGRYVRPELGVVTHAQGISELAAAMRAVWRDNAFPKRPPAEGDVASSSERARVAVLVQVVGAASASGGSFSKNPVTGLDEIVVEAARGGGEASRQAEVPDRWVFKWGKWLERPSVERVPAAVVQEVAEQTRKIARAFGNPLVLEWAYDGGRILWLNAEPLAFAAEARLYSRRIAKEVLPGLIKPLAWSVNVPLVNGAWVKLLTEVIGPNDIDPMSLSRCFYYRAYFDMGTLGRVFRLMGLPRETLELLMGLEGGDEDRPRFKPSRKTYRHLPRLMRFAADKWRFRRRLDRYLQGADVVYATFAPRDAAGLTEHALLDEVDRLFPIAQETAYYNIVAPLLMHLYSGLLKSRLAKEGIDYARLDLTSGLDVLAELDPNTQLSGLRRLFSALPEESQKLVLAEGLEALPSTPEVDALRRAREAFLDRFGHLSDSGNDFSVSPWREQPELILRMASEFGGAPDSIPPKAGIGTIEAPLHRRWMISAILRRLRVFLVYRAVVGSLYTRGYGLFRSYFLALGDRFVTRGLIASRDDVFLLAIDEVRGLVAGESGLEDVRERVRVRHEEMEEAARVDPPETLFGETPAAAPGPLRGRLSGIPTSRGHYQGPARVVQGIQDFRKVRAGDVLVVPYTDVGWTPLFSKAGAVVSESGGTLSHCSIIAREYGIPAVVSVPQACRLADGTIVAVDGYTGDVLIHEEGE